MKRPARFAHSLFVTLVAFAFFGGANPAAAARVALVIGNADYEHTVPLANPRNDAEAISSALMELGFDVFDGFDLTRGDTEDLIREFAKAAGSAEVAMLYYAGHGLEVGGINYLVPVDAQIRDEADLKFETINLSDIIELMERGQRTNLIFLDACRDNPMAGNLARNMGTRSTAIGRGLARVDTGVGTMIAYATQPGNVALDGSGRHSPFTTALLDHIATPELDVELMMRRVRIDVMQQTDGQQVPWSSSSLTGSFIFQMQPPPPAISAAPPTADPQIALLAPDIAPELVPEPETRPVPAPAALAPQTRDNIPAPPAASVPTSAPEDESSDQPEQDEALAAQELARQSQAALNRLGCDAGVEDGIWGRKSRSALERLAEHAGTIELASLEPSEELLRDMEQLDGRICPLVCAATENLIDGACIRKTCPSGQRLASNGACFTPKTTTRRSAPSSSRSGSSCFTLNGQKFCQ